ncbi:FkbM family methyltransferase [Brevibacillus centrosporus]|uniref:FkbM family methyltransferase n=1 Tax=Brevibacillus centrosporus TaxID=54910 RepID=UPI002E1B2EFF|nr:FkbM family methyltransferase [Brevibacillus centrosporus]MED4912160.1 FkbM family methyltransferase [Brevibacillus centrosporus]
MTFEDVYYLGDNTHFKKTLNGPYMFLDPRDGVNLSIMLFGQWEEWITKHFMAAVKPGMTVLDIGAHCGYYSLLAGMRVYPGGCVHSFEPLPFHHKRFMKSVSVNGMTDRVHLHKVMLSNKIGEIEIPTNSEEGGAIITYHGVNELSKLTNVKVKQGILTDYLPSLKADVIKMDIDGSEPLIMHSLLQVIDNSKAMTIFMEYAPHLWKGFDPLSIMNGFVDRGFKINILRYDGQIESVTPQQLAGHDSDQWLDLMLVR